MLAGTDRSIASLGCNYIPVDGTLNKKMSSVHRFLHDWLHSTYRPSFFL